MFYMDEQTQRAIKKFPHRAADIAQSYDAKQLKCKEWLCDYLEIINLPKFKRIYITGGWYGNILCPKLKELYPNTQLRLHDIDKEAISICKNIFFKNDKFVKPDYVDSSQYQYKYFTINTSCEHMPPLDMMPGSYVALQSNNYFEIKEHINCVNSASELADQYDMKEVYYQGELEFDKYTRYMVIGRV